MDPTQVPCQNSSRLQDDAGRISKFIIAIFLIVTAHFSFFWVWHDHQNPWPCRIRSYRSGLMNLRREQLKEKIAGFRWL